MSSAANTVPPTTERENQDGSPSTRPNSLALEMAVSVTGARAGSEAARELFTEETQTVLVFRDGAVIRLTAPVVAGQLLFVTNTKSKEEVVCQVLRKRPFGATACYVELQFTEEKPDYWGVAFPQEQKSGAESRTSEHVEAEKTTAADPATPVAPHSAEEVDELKKEVEALRHQLLELEKKKAAEAAGETAKAVLAMGAFARGKEELAPVNDPSPEPAKKDVHEGSPGQSSPRSSGQAEAKPAEKPTVDAPLMPAAMDKKEAARAVVSMALPMRKNEDKGTTKQAKDPSEELLPKPELDFSKMPSPEQAGTAMKLGKPRATGGRKMLPLLGVLMVVLAAAVWYGKMWTYLPFGKKAARAVAAAPARAAKAGAAVPAAAKTGTEGPATGSAGSTESATAKNTAVKGASSASDGAGAVAEKSESAGPKAAGGAEGSASGDAAEAEASRAANAEVVAPKKAVVAKGKNKAATAEGATAEGNAAETVASDAPVLPAKLMKAANPVYPPEAMRNYITGDVKVEAVVEADGRVGEVKVLSGPKPLRDAAVEALKRYQYAPATQGGKAVASKVTATVKFWFNP